MALQFPVDFSEKVRLPASPASGGYPYSISAGDLMSDFNYAALQADSTAAEGLYLEEFQEGDNRKVRLAGSLELEDKTNLSRLGLETVDVMVCESNSPKMLKLVTSVALSTSA
jgi:hypothetical protein